MSLSLDVSNTDPTRDWSYLSEGGASMVFSYIGPPHPSYNGTVLRLRKSLHQNAPWSHYSPPALHDASLAEEPDDPSIAFQQEVTSKLIPNIYLPRLQTASVNSQWLKQLQGVAGAHRPAERAAKDSIDTSRCKAVLATDLVGGRGWAVEIKPKWGFLPSPVYLSPSTRELKARHCRFCMHSHLKGIKEGVSVTCYCPLDFFSGDEARVRRALQSLWEAWLGSQGKTNNLRVFNEGKIVNPVEPHSLSSLAEKVLGPNHNTMSPSDLLSSFVDALSRLVLDTTLVSILATLQRKLDSLDIEGLSYVWSRSHPGVPLGQGEPDPTLSEWECFIRTYLASGKETLRHNILAYILSATFKDCSIILRPHNKGGHEKVEDTITVIDLDPKSVSRLSKWETLDQDIVRSFEGVAGERVVCIDARKTSTV